jgi:hypothetical protein
MDIKEPCIVCSLDKDLNMIPGLHYSWPINRGGKEIRPGRIYEIDEEAGMRCFYTQILTGDTSDNVKGIDGIGPVKAEKLLSFCKNEQQMFMVVSSKYEEQWGEEWEQKLYNNMQLLWILREPDGYYKFPIETESFGEAKRVRGTSTAVI